jgi:riboflavin biosynthesis pyrimidine reductase
MEAGPALLVEAIRKKLIDELFLTRSPITGGENPLEIEDLLQDAALISSEDVEGTLLLQYRF